MFTKTLNLIEIYSEILEMQQTVEEEWLHNYLIIREEHIKR
jgi:hypothetical protein